MPFLNTLFISSSCCLNPNCFKKHMKYWSVSPVYKRIYFFIHKSFLALPLLQTPCCISFYSLKVSKWPLAKCNKILPWPDIKNAVCIVKHFENLKDFKTFMVVLVVGGGGGGDEAEENSGGTRLYLHITQMSKILSE